MSDVDVGEMVLHRFLRYDRHERNRSLVRTESFHVLALRRWAERKLKSLAQPGGIVYILPVVVEYFREPDIRATSWYVWTEYGLLPDRPGQVFCVPRPVKWESQL